MSLESATRPDVLDSASAKIKEFFSGMRITSSGVNSAWMDSFIRDSIASGVIDVSEDVFFSELYAIARADHSPK